jgi:hypothetical protein
VEIVIQEVGARGSTLDSHSFGGLWGALIVQLLIGPCYMQLVSDERHLSTDERQLRHVARPAATALHFVTPFVTPWAIQPVEPVPALSREKPAKTQVFFRAMWHTGC